MVAPCSCSPCEHGEQEETFVRSRFALGLRLRGGGGGRTAELCMHKNISPTSHQESEAVEGKEAGEGKEK